VDKKVIGPAYQEVAAKYRGQAGAEEQLVQKVKNGGSGVWGPVPMPPNPQVKDDDVRAMVRWILALK
jgi:cytochrome c